MEAGDWKAFAKRHPAKALKMWGRGQWLAFRRTIGRPRAGAGDEAETTAPDIAEMVDELKTIAAERQVVSRIQNFRDREMFRPAYLESEPYLRLSLREISYEALPDAESDREQDPQRAEILLLIHRSGTMLLTVPYSISGPVSSAQTVRQSRSSSVRLKWSEVAEPILEYAHMFNPGELAGEWVDEATGVRWRRIEHDGVDATLRDVFLEYRDAIAAAGRVVLENEWRAHPTVCIGKVSCCSTEKRWRARHGAEVMALLMQHEGADNIRTSHDSLRPPDSSVLKHRSTWHSVGGSVNINWDPNETPRFDDDLWALTLVDNFLLQHWQLRLLSGAIDAAGLDLKKLRLVQQRIATDLDEYYQSAHLYGTAQETVDRLLEQSGSVRNYRQLLERSSQLSSVLTAARAERTAARNLYVAASGVLLAGVFGLPALSQTITIASKIPPSSSAHWWATPLRWVGSFGDAGTWFLFMALIGVLALALVASTLRRRPKRRKPPRPVGLAWPHGQVQIRYDNGQPVDE